MLQAGKLDGEAVFKVTHHAALPLPNVTSDPIAGRWSLAIPAPDSDTSMTRQVRLTPLGKIRRPTGLRGTIRPWRRSSGKPRM
jgi:hypothetical protein